LAAALAGHPKYEVTSGSITLDGQDVLAMSVDERARAGLFLAMQYPVEVPGISVANFLRTAKTAIAGEAPPLRTWGKEVSAAMANLRIDPIFAARNVNEGFSGGEKKRHEILQLELLKPRFAILDETDSGLDVDALRIVSQGVNRAIENTDVGVILITHYTRILRYIKPDFVHVFVNGRIAEEGGPELAEQLEEEGYDRFQPGSGSAIADPGSADNSAADNSATSGAREHESPIEKEMRTLTSPEDGFQPPLREAQPDVSAKVEDDANFEGRF
jgi:Fe-S cluster assembly ATP-binding protein